jgi:uncharacterized membrane protein YedE/YeeE
LKFFQLILALASLLVGLGSAIAGWWISSATGRRIEYLFAMVHLWFGLLLIAGAIVVLFRSKAVPVTVLAAGLAICLLSFSMWKNARLIFGDDAYSRAKNGTGRIPLE